MGPTKLANHVDPRLPSAAIPFRRYKLKEDDIPPDFSAMLSLAFGIFGTLIKSKVAGWLSLLAALSSLANIRTAEMDTKQLVCSCSFAIMAIVTSYTNKAIQAEETK
mmetsp:Transcript_32110/g.44516  ORF Transcript_32110/g.44516 Transcript_32110/m.44516 type:complete len:107 (-) Transcript_32110:223-543(-)|eukprot:CAMPEP_0196571852 /NCGR_PEP_ID=MMETSP1081-20130531/1986_1 /TAXON_ID=36882 /ORGANISM="Pyramimonas amylifera, Strain CCMP720" /LENGTH=106 /DNA_ID=CAMNT_0041888961 /DNA_START=119 /DNA_END=439 /DNA_ORIENTATION=+